MTYDTNDDIIDRVAGLAPNTVTHALRHQRAKVVQSTQGSYDGLFDPDLEGLPLVERLLVALYASRLTPSPALAAHYRAELSALGVDAATLAAVETGTPETLAAPRLRAILAFTRTLIENPVAGDKAVLQTLPAAGLSTPAVVALAQLIAFLSYQTRLVAGLQAFKQLEQRERAS
ncbi:CMD domain protein [Paraburkholderia sp. J76]|uniref:CMD domain-containing protein n=1 Tax=Paraburkholderia sp. J76 TaxID=2805439 RepID=UPI002ABD8E1C|nr:CMD domain protein [Paraburkholderia sp. J76]